MPHLCSTLAGRDKKKKKNLPCNSSQWALSELRWAESDVTLTLTSLLLLPCRVDWTPSLTHSLLNPTNSPKTSIQSLFKNDLLHLEPLPPRVFPPQSTHFIVDPGQAALMNGRPSEFTSQASRVKSLPLQTPESLEPSLTVSRPATATPTARCWHSATGTSCDVAVSMSRGRRCRRRVHFVYPDQLLIRPLL